MNVIILGAGYGGLTAALRLARRAKRRVQVVLINPRDVLVERIRLHEDGAGRPPRLRSIPALIAGTGITFVQGSASAVDLPARTVTVNDQTHPFDHLIVATGSRIDDRVPGVREHTFTLEAAGARLLAERLSTLDAAHSRLVVVGGGLTAIEAATELAERHPRLHVALVTRGLLGPEFSQPARDHLRKTFARLNIELLEHTAVERVESNALRTADGLVAFDACVWASGFLASRLPEGLTVQTNARGQLIGDEMLRARSDPFVWGVGDAVTCSLPFPMGCKSAGPSGAHVADNLLRTLEGAPLEVFDYHAPFYCVSLGRADGLLQRTTPDGALHGSFLGGRFAALIKELICRYTVWALTLERLGLASYETFKPKRTPALERGRHGA